MRLLNINMKTNSTSVQDLTDRDWPHVMLASMKAVMNEDLIKSSWKKEGMVPFSRAPEKSDSMALSALIYWLRK